jgi:alginate O-acetyltransferase complex protein AlgI
LGGNRRGWARTYANLAITMLLGGLWHGAAWTFVTWGAYQGVLLILHRLSAPVLAHLRPTRRLFATAWAAFRMFVFFQLVCIGWVLFRVANLGDASIVAAQVVTALSSTPSIPHEMWLAWGGILLLSLPVILIEIWQEGENNVNIVLQSRARWLIVFVLLSYIFLAGVTRSHAFIYFQF